MLLMHAMPALVSTLFSRSQRSIPYFPSKDMSEGFISLAPLSPNIDIIEFNISRTNSCRFMVFSDITSIARYLFFSRSVGIVFILSQYLPVYNSGSSFSVYLEALYSLHRPLLFQPSRKSLRSQPSPLEHA